MILLKEPSQTTNIQGCFKVMIPFKYTLKVFRNNFTQLRGPIKKNLNIFMTLAKSCIVKFLFKFRICDFIIFLSRFPCLTRETGTVKVLFFQLRRLQLHGISFEFCLQRDHIQLMGANLLPSSFLEISFLRCTNTFGTLSLFQLTHMTAWTQITIIKLTKAVSLAFI